MPDSKRLSLQIGALLSRKKECAMNETGRERGVLGDFHIQAVIDRLHDKAEAQRREPSQQHEPADADERKRYLSERYVALDREKAEFCYLLSLNVRASCRGSRHVIRCLDDLPRDRGATTAAVRSPLRNTSSRRRRRPEGISPRLASRTWSICARVTYGTHCARSTSPSTLC
jgi:hypothetical protein